MLLCPRTVAWTALLCMKFAPREDKNTQPASPKIEDSISTKTALEVLRKAPFTYTQKQACGLCDILVDRSAKFPFMPFLIFRQLFPNHRTYFHHHRPTHFSVPNAETPEGHTVIEVTPKEFSGCVIM